MGCQSVLLRLETLDDTETFVPALLQLGSDQAIIGVDSVVLPTRPARLIACLLDREFDLAPLPGLRHPGRLDRAKGRLHPERLNARDDFRHYRPVDTHAAERNAWRPAMIDVTAATMIAPGVAVRAAIGDVQLATAMAAAEQTGQECVAPAGPIRGS